MTPDVDPFRVLHTSMVVGQPKLLADVPGRDGGGGPSMTELAAPGFAEEFSR